MTTTADGVGRITRVSGSVIGVVGLEGIRLFDVVQVGEMGLIGEVIQLSEDVVTVQMYEDCSGIRTGEPVRSTGLPLVVELGPGMLGQVCDGLQRPLSALAQLTGNFLQRGKSAEALPGDKLWSFQPRAKAGQEVGPGDVLGVVPESGALEHRIMVPPGLWGRVLDISAGEFTVHDPVTVLNLETPKGPVRRDVTMVQRWPVRRPRPFAAKLDPGEPLLTGIRVIDVFFPVAKGGSAIVPGGFGTGKTVIEQSLARWADVDVVIYVGCGERGNEMTEILEEFPRLEDPRNGAPLMSRTVLIANTSNMPVAAREASIYTGITIAEYYRDMGYDVLLLADSTSRWGEALREISGRLEEMPGEEGYPAYLGARLSEFYERSGRITCVGCAPDGDSPRQRTGSVTVVGAVSPPGGDFSEPVTQSSMRVAGTLWALDYDLSRRRHFPAINWSSSYSLYSLQDWFGRQVADDWAASVQAARGLLQRESELLEILQLVGPDTLSEAERAILLVARMVREDFLLQTPYHPVDRFCSVDKAYWMLKTILVFHQHVQTGLRADVPLSRLADPAQTAEIGRMRDLTASEVQALHDRLARQLGERR